MNVWALRSCLEASDRILAILSGVAFAVVPIKLPPVTRRDGRPG